MATEKEKQEMIHLQIQMKLLDTSMNRVIKDADSLLEKWDTDGLKKADLTHHQELTQKSLELIHKDITTIYRRLTDMERKSDRATWYYITLSVGVFVTLAKAMMDSFIGK